MLKKIVYSLLLFVVTSVIANGQTTDDETMPWDQPVNGKDKPKKEKKSG